MYEPTFTDGGHGWRSHGLNEPKQITDERILHKHQRKNYYLVSLSYGQVHI